MQPLMVPSEEDAQPTVVRSASLMDAANLLMTNFTIPISAAVSPSKSTSNAFAGGTFVAIPNYPINDDHRTLLDTLADIASLKSPIRKKRVHIDDSSISYSFRNQSLSRDSTNEAENTNEVKVGRRPRAMSEPWVVDDSWVKTLQEAHHMVSMSKTGSSGDTNFSGSNDSILNNNQTYPSAPQILNKYTMSRYSTHPFNYICHTYSLTSNSYNKNGRVGIYTREERNIIIQKFYEKRKRRVWKKKIRYHCRKNLADRRVRVKGRFVKGGADAAGGAASAPIEAKDAEIDDDEEDEDEEEDEVQTTVNVDVISVKLPNISRQNSTSFSSGASEITVPASLVPSALAALDTSEPPTKRVRRHSIAY